MILIVFAGVMAQLSSAASIPTSSCPGTAVYSINVETRWSADTHPRAFPGTDAAFEDIHGTSHSSRSNWASPAQQIQCGGGNSEQAGSFKVDMHCPQPGEALYLQSCSIEQLNFSLSLCGRLKIGAPTRQLCGSYHSTQQPQNSLQASVKQYRS